MRPALGDIAYTAYRESVGGRAWNGDPLPTWAELEADPAKARLVTAWETAAEAIRDEVRRREYQP